MKEPRASELEPQVPSPAACFRKSTWPRVEASCGEGVARDRPVRVLPCPGYDLGALDKAQCPEVLSVTDSGVCEEPGGTPSMLHLRGGWWGPAVHCVCVCVRARARVCERESLSNREMYLQTEDLLLVATPGPLVKTKTALGKVGAGGTLPKGCEEGAVWGRGRNNLTSVLSVRPE